MTIELFAILMTMASGTGVAGCITMALRENRRADRDQVAGVGAALRAAHPISPAPTPQPLADLLDQLRDA